MAADHDADDDDDKGDDCHSPVFGAKVAPSRTLVGAARLRSVDHRIPLYCLDFASGDVRSAPARKTPEIPDRIERTPGISNAVAVGAGWPGCAALAPAFALCSGAVAAP